MVKKNLDDLTKLKLSDAFEIKQDSNDFEWTATVININKNHNEALLKKCFSLYHYCSYIEKVKENLNAGMSKQDAVNKALNFAIKQNYLDGFFKQQKMEVLGMSLTEFDQEEYDKNRREEAFEAAHYQTAKIALKKNLPLELISELTGLSIEEITSIKESSLA